jgi:hypothetical protein
MNPIEKYRQKKQAALNLELLHAANFGLSTLQALLNRGADLHATTAGGHNLLDLTWDEDNFRFFLDKGLAFSSERAIHRAAQHCMSNPELFTRLIKMAADINYCHNNNGSLLHNIRGYEHFETLLTALLDNKADINVQHPVSGRTVLHEACADKNIPSIRLLLKYQARTDIKDIDGETAIDLARRLYTEASLPHQSVIDALTQGSSDLPQDKIPSKNGQAEISFIHDKPDLGLRITEIFNFKSGIYREIIYSKKTNTQSSSILPFDALEHTRHFADAKAEFIKQGGVPDYAFKKRLDKQ